MENGKKHKILMGCGWGVLTIALLFAIAAIFASPIAKHIVNSKGEEIIGRQLYAERVRVNLFTGGVTLEEFQCYELNGTTNFFNFERLYVKIAYPRLLAKNLKIRHFHLDGFNGQVLQNKDKLNFSDIIERFSANDSTGKPWKVSVGDIRLAHSSVYYHDVQHRKEWQLEDINVSIPGLDFANEDTNAGLDFALPTGGVVQVEAGYHAPTNMITLWLTMVDVNPDVVLPLVQDHVQVSSLHATMNGRLHLQARLDNIENIAVKGSFNVRDLQVLDAYEHDVLSLDEMRVAVNRIDLGTNTFELDSLVLEGLTGSYEVHKNWTTLSRLQKPGTSSDASSSNSVRWIAKNALLTAHDLTYNDYSQKNDWSYGFKTLQAEGKNVSNFGRNTFKINGVMLHNAKLKADFVGSLDVKKQPTSVHVTLSNVNLNDFDALSRNYTGYPVESGTLYAESTIDFKYGKVTGNTRLVIDDPVIGKKERLTKAKYRNLPVRSAFKSLVDSENRVHINAPLSADMNKKDYSFTKVFAKSLAKETFGHMMRTKGMKDKISESEREEIEELLEDDDLSDQDEKPARGIRRNDRKRKR